MRLTRDMKNSIRTSLMTVGMLGVVTVVNDYTKHNAGKSETFPCLWEWLDKVSGKADTDDEEEADDEEFAPEEDDKVDTSNIRIFLKEKQKREDAEDASEECGVELEPVENEAPTESSDPELTDNDPEGEE